MRVLFSLVCLLFSISTITALQTALQSKTTPLLLTEIDQSLTFDRFDGSLGTLDTITLVVTVTGSFDVSLTNNGATPVSVKATSNSDINIDSPLFASPPAVTVSGTTGTQSINQGQTVPFTNLPGNAQQTFTVTFTGGAQNVFIGVGQTVPIRFFSLSGLSVQGGGGNVASSQTTRVQVGATLQYTYTATAQVAGDPQFAGFQGQHFQFHGEADTVFNLISSPELQMNALFVYIASGICNYNETACFSHAGTYLGRIGISIGSRTFTIVSGPHSEGLRMYIQTGDVRTAMKVGSQSAFSTPYGNMYIGHSSQSRVEIRTPTFAFTLVNSDSFLNLQASLLNTPLLNMGSTKHHIRECTDTASIEHMLSKHYPVKNTIHGLVGQTWRNVKFCDHPYQGVVDDYIATHLFANDYTYNFFNITQ